MKKLFFLLLIVCALPGFCQTVLENNPTGLKWNQIKTPNFRIIFPKGFDLQAQRVASTLEHIRTAESRTMGKEPHKISVILQNQSAISNGFVSMFPRRSEFYTMPAQSYNFTGSNDWLNLLSSHEYRHIVQYQHANRGFNRLLYYLFGYPTLAGMAHLSAPDWFWEGDAVVTETAFTPSGRGRIPYFNLLFRTNISEGRIFNYQKQYLRSYKHQIPDHYVLGFQMVSYLRKRTNDPDIWEKITKRSWSVPFIPFAFSNAIRNKTGLSVTRLYREMAKDLQKEWKERTDTLRLTEFESVNKRSGKAYTDYLYPQALSDGSVLAMKQGIGDIQRFVIIRDGKEKKVFTPGFINDSGMLSSTDNVVVWNEYGFDPRWQVKTFSLIKAYDWKNKQRIVVSDRDSKFGGATISPDGKHIATVRTDTKYNHTLLILAYPSGVIEKQFSNPDNYFYSMARWSDDGQKICALKLKEAGKTVSLIDVSSGTEQELFPVTNENIGYPVLKGDFLFFSSAVTGIDNIHVLELSSGKRFQITSSKYGAYNPSVAPDNSFLYYNEQTRDGMDVVRVPLEPQKWTPFEQTTPKLGYDYLIEQEGTPTLLNNVPEGKYPVSKFSKFGHIINPFSWGVVVQNDLSKIDLGIASQDILSTMSLNAGYTIDLNEETGYWRVGLSYQALYPIIDLNYVEGTRAVDEDFTTAIIKDGETSTVTDTYEFTWKEKTVTAGLRVPLVFTQSKYSTGLDLGYAVGLTKVSDFYNGINSSRYFPAVIKDDVVQQSYLLIDYVTNGTIVYDNASISAYRLLKRSHRDFVSRWGQTISFQYYNTPFGGDFEGGLYSVTSNLFFPGLFKHHALYGQVSYQKTMIPTEVEANNYLFRNTVPLPRGINDYVSRFRDFTSASLNYAFPLWYPDISIGPVLNIQRIRLNIFGDVASGRSSIFQDKNADYLSVGGELKFDINVFRFLPQLDLGVRYSYGIEPSVDSFEFVIGAFNL